MKKMFCYFAVFIISCLPVIVQSQSSLAEKHRFSESVNEDPEILFLMHAEIVASKYPNRPIYRCESSGLMSWGDIYLVTEVAAKEATDRSFFYVVWVFPMLDDIFEDYVRYDPPLTASLTWQSEPQGLLMDFQLVFTQNGIPSELYTRPTFSRLNSAILKYPCRQIL